MLFSDYLKKINTQFYTAINNAEKVESAQIGSMEEYDEIYLFQDAIILDERSAYHFERDLGIDTDMDADGRYIFRFEGYVAYTNDIEGVQVCIDYYNNESESIFEEGKSKFKGNKLSEAYSDYDDEEEDTINVFFGYDVSADEVVAIFPDEIADYKGNITCYAHNGQHSACSKEYAKGLKPASGNEYRPLYKELIGQGYSKLNILKKLSIR